MSAPTRPPSLGATRARVLALLQRSAGHLTVPEIATALDLHRNSARFHLDALVDAGYVTRTKAEPSGQGRPPLLFIANSETPVLNNDHLLELTEVLLRHFVAKAPDAAAAGEAAGRDWGMAAAPQDATDPEEVLAELMAHLTERGFGPIRDGQEVCFTRCPFRVSILAEQLPLVCQIHRGFIDGFLENSPGSMHTTELTIDPEVCSAVLSTPNS